MIDQTGCQVPVADRAANRGPDDKSQAEGRANQAQALGAMFFVGDIRHIGSGQGDVAAGKAIKNSAEEKHENGPSGHSNSCRLPILWGEEAIGQPSTERFGKAKQQETDHGPDDTDHDKGPTTKAI